MRVILAGGRDFSDYDGMVQGIADSGFEISQVVSGGARGADALGEKYAKKNGIELNIFPADWEQFGKAAGHIRNAEMADNADALIAFWDGESRGTKNMIETAKTKGLKVYVHKYRQESIWDDLF
tara:strand:- start:3310 stop:3681 length:372 start_codon:yes stop_codon:yes gene_type:complete